MGDEQGPRAAGCKAPLPRHVSAVFAAQVERRLGRHAATLLAHPTRRLHVFTSRGRHLLRRQGRLGTPLGYLGPFVANAAHRRALGVFLERVVFSDPREPLPVPLTDFRTRQVALDAMNLAPAIVASCSIPFWLDAVHDVPGGPRGAYWDGGITDYHLHLDDAANKANASHESPGGPSATLDAFNPTRTGKARWL